MRTILNSEAYQAALQKQMKATQTMSFTIHNAYVKPLSAEQFFFSMLQATGFERLQQGKLDGLTKRVWRRPQRHATHA